MILKHRLWFGITRLKLASSLLPFVFSPLGGDGWILGVFQSKNPKEVPNGIRRNGFEHKIVQKSLQQKCLKNEIVSVQTPVVGTIDQSKAWNDWPIKSVQTMCTFDGGGEEGGGRAYSFVVCFNRMIIDHASLTYKRVKNQNHANPIHILNPSPERLKRTQLGLLDLFRTLYYGHGVITWTNVASHADISSCRGRYETDPFDWSWIASWQAAWTPRIAATPPMSRTLARPARQLKRGKSKLQRSQNSYGWRTNRL